MTIVFGVWTYHGDYLRSARRVGGYLRWSIYIIGTYLKYLDSMYKHMDNEQLNGIFSPLFTAVLNSVYIELFKIFDKGKEASDNNIFALIKYLDGDDHKYSKCNNPLSKYKKVIESIRNRRNKIYAHDLLIDIDQFLYDNPISDIDGLLSELATICHDAYNDLLTNTYASNVKDFDDWIYMSQTSIDEVCKLNDLLHSKHISREDFYVFLNTNLDRLS